MAAKWMDVEISDWLVEWMNESVIHCECCYSFLLWHRANFWSYSWDVEGCNSKLSLINPIQTSWDHLLLVHCRLHRPSVYLSPRERTPFSQPSSIPGNTHEPSPYRKQALFRSLTTNLYMATVLITKLSWNLLLHRILPYFILWFFLSLLQTLLPFQSLFPTLPQEFPEAPFYPLFFLCFSHAQPQPWSQPLGWGPEHEQMFKAV